MVGFSTFDSSYIRSDSQLMRFIRSTSLISCFSDGSMRAISFNSSKSIMRLAQTSDRVADYLLLVDDDPRLRASAPKAAGRLSPCDLLLACFNAYTLGEILFRIDLQGAVREYRDISRRAGVPGIAGSESEEISPALASDKALQKLSQDENLFYLLLESVARETVINKKKDPLWFQFAEISPERGPSESGWGLGTLSATVVVSIAEAVRKLSPSSSRRTNRSEMNFADLGVASQGQQRRSGQPVSLSLENALGAVKQHAELLTYYLASLEAKEDRFVLLAQFFKDTGIWAAMREIGVFCQIYGVTEHNAVDGGSLDSDSPLDIVKACGSPFSLRYRSIFSALTVFSEANAALYGLLGTIHARLVEALDCLERLLGHDGRLSHRAAKLGEVEALRQLREAVISLGVVSALENFLVRNLLNNNPAVKDFKFFKLRKDYCLTELELLLSWSTIGVELDCEFPSLLCQFAEALEGSDTEGSWMTQSVIFEENELESLMASGASGADVCSFAVEALAGYLHAALASRESNLAVFEFSSQLELPRWLDGCLDRVYQVVLRGASTLYVQDGPALNLLEAWRMVSQERREGAEEGDSPQRVPAWSLEPEDWKVIRFTPALLSVACPSLPPEALAETCASVRFLVSSVRLADCYLQLQYFRLAVEEIKKDNFCDKRDELASCFCDLRFQAPPVAGLLAKYHAWGQLIEYCITLYKISDLEQGNVFDTVVFDPSLAVDKGATSPAVAKKATPQAAYNEAKMKALTSYALCYSRRYSRALADSRIRPEDLLPFLPSDMLGLLALILRNDNLWMLESPADAYEKLISAFVDRGFKRRLFCMLEDDQEGDNGEVYRRMGNYILGHGPRLRARDCAAAENEFLAGAVDLMRVADSK